MNNANEASITLLGMGSALPNRMPQSIAAGLAIDCCCGSDGERAWLKRVYDRSGVSSRGCVLRSSDDNAGDDLRQFYPSRQSPDDCGPTTAARMRRYAIDAPPLAERAARAAMDDACVEAEAITHLITVSCTGFFAPGMDAALIERLRLRSTVQRTHIGFMGCHAALNALNVARSIAQANAEAKVLVCCIELCTLHFAYGWRPERIVANSLFGDGAAAVVVGRATTATDSHWRLRGGASLLLPGSAALMGWIIGDHGFEMSLSPEVPARVRASLKDWMGHWAGHVDRHVDHWAIHPGGPKVITAVGEAMELSEAQLEPSRGVLREMGNMSSGTLLMILQRLRNTQGRCAMLGFGPGLMMEGVIVER